MRNYFNYVKVNRKDSIRLSAFRLNGNDEVFVEVLGKLSDSSLDRRNEFSGDTFTKTSALRDTGNVVPWGRLCPCICYIKIYGCGFNETLSVSVFFIVRRK